MSSSEKEALKAKIAEVESERDVADVILDVQKLVYQHCAGRVFCQPTKARANLYTQLANEAAGARNKAQADLDSASSSLLELRKELSEMEAAEKAASKKK